MYNNNMQDVLKRIAEAKQIMRDYNNNPMQVIKNMASNNPEVNQILQMMEGKTPEQQLQLFYSIANQKGYGYLIDLLR